MKNIVALLTIVFSLILLSNQSFAQLSEEVEKKTPELPGEISIDVGFNLLYGKPGNWDETHWWRSKSFGAYFLKRFEVNNKIEFVPGIGVTVDKVGSKNANFLDLENNPDSLIFIPANANIIKAQMMFGFIEAPLELRYNILGNKSKGSPYIAIGGVAGVGFESKMKVKYENRFTGDNTKKKAKGGPHVLDSSTFRFGAIGRIGVGNFSIFYKHYFTPIFSGGSFYSDETYFSTIGISVSGF